MLSRLDLTLLLVIVVAAGSAILPLFELFVGLLLSTPIQLERAAVDKLFRDPEGLLELGILLPLRLGQLMRVLDDGTAELVDLAEGLLVGLDFEQHFPVGRHFLSDLLVGAALIAKHVLQLEAFDLELPLPFVIEDALIGTPMGGGLAALDLLLGLVLDLVLGRPNVGEIAGDIAVRARSADGRQPDPVVHRQPAQ